MILIFKVIQLSADELENLSCSIRVPTGPYCSGMFDYISILKKIYFGPPVLRLQIHAFQKSIKIVLQFWYSFWYSFGTVLIQFGTVVVQSWDSCVTVSKLYRTVSKLYQVQFWYSLIQFWDSFDTVWYSFDTVVQLYRKCLTTVSKLYQNCTKTVSKLYQTVSKMCPKIRVRPCWKNAGRVSGDPKKV